MAIVISPAAVATATNASQARSPQPDVGRWKIENLNGSFVVIKKVVKVKVHGKSHKKIKEFVKNLTYVDSAQLGDFCAGRVVVAGPLPITAWHSNYGEYWFVGSLKHMQSNFPTEIHARANLNGQPLSGLTIAMLFSNSRTGGPSKTLGHLEVVSNAGGSSTCPEAPYFDHG